jgi:hypothetical protein
MARRRNTAIVIFLLLAGGAGLVGPGASLAYNLTGRWHSPLPAEGGGTTLELMQTGNTVTWQGGPDDRAWLQEFTGSLSGGVFSGEFSQHAPGQSQLYRGSLSAQVIGECEFKTLHALQVGQPDAGGATFTKTPCPPPSQARYNFGFRLASRAVGLSTGSHGSFTTNGQPDSSGKLAVSAVSASGFTLAWRFHGKRWSMAFVFTGGGTYRLAGNDLDLDLAVKRSNLSECRSGSSQASGIELQPHVVYLSICGKETSFAIPSRATDWIKQA